MKRDSSTASELAAELSLHKMKLQEVVVEGLGESETAAAEVALAGGGDEGGALPENGGVERIETNFEEMSPNKRPYDQMIEAHAQVSSILSLFNGNLGGNTKLVYFY